jgi:hypothetical protein
MSKLIASLDKTAFFDADKAVLTSLGLPRAEGQWSGGGVHVIGPDPAQPEKLWTLHDRDPMQTADGKTFAYEPTVEPKVAPAKCVLVEKSPAKWRDAVAVAVAVQEEPLEEGAEPSTFPPPRDGARAPKSTDEMTP